MGDRPCVKGDGLQTQVWTPWGKSCLSKPVGEGFGHSRTPCPPRKKLDFWPSPGPLPAGLLKRSDVPRIHLGVKTTPLKTRSAMAPSVPSAHAIGQGRRIG